VNAPTASSGSFREQLRQENPGWSETDLPPEAWARFERLADASPLYARLLRQHPEYCRWLEEPHNRDTDYRYQALLLEWRQDSAAAGRDLTNDEAYLGASIEVPTPDGPVQMKVPPKSTSGTTLRLRDKGVARADRRGDLYVELLVQVPDRDDASLAETLRDGARLYSRPVREGIRF